jgi:trehalose 6-phosphate synthase/phosphatase
LTTTFIYLAIPLRLTLAHSIFSNLPAENSHNLSRPQTTAAMDQNAGAANGAPQADPAENNPPRPGIPDRAESSLPPHLRPSVIGVPVTPGITREAYESESSDKADGEGAGHSEPGYFSLHDVDHAIAASPAPDTTNREGQSFQNKIDAGVQESTEFMRRLSIAVMHPPTDTSAAESMHDIRSISPDLALTGNIISATFNIPHSVKYRKGDDWVSTNILPSDYFFPLACCLDCPARTATQAFAKVG